MNWNSQAAKMAVYAVVVVIAIEAVVMSIILLCCRSFIGYISAMKRKLWTMWKKLAPLLSLSFIIDGLQAAFSGMFPSFNKNIMYESLLIIHVKTYKIGLIFSLKIYKMIWLQLK